jgi:hypothetical protein
VIDDVSVIVEVTLIGTRPAVHRLISIPYALPLNRFHSVLQVVMGWDGQAAHIFAGGDLIAANPNEISLPDGDPEDESQLIVKDLLPFITAEACYCYDLSTEWVHRLRFLGFDHQLRTNEITLLKARGKCPVEGAATRASAQAAKRGDGAKSKKKGSGKQSSSAGTKKSKTENGSVDLASINDELTRLSRRWRRRRRTPADNGSSEMILLDTAKIRAGYLSDLQNVRNRVLAIEDDLARHESQDVPEFRRYLNVQFGARFSIMRELQQEIDWLAARLALVQKLMQHGVRPVGKAYLQAIQIETGEAPYPDFPPQPDEPPLEAFEPEDRFARETIKNFISETGDEFMTDEEVEALTEDVLEAAGERDLVTECKSLYRKIVSLLHPDRAGEMTPERKDLWLRAQDAYGDGDVLSLRSILDRCGAGTRDQYLICSEIIEAIAEAMVQLQAIEMFREREAQEASWDFCRLSEKRRMSRLRRVAKDLDEEENNLKTQVAELQRECESLQEKARHWERHQGGETAQMDLFR